MEVCNLANHLHMASSWKVSDVIARSLSHPSIFTPPSHTTSWRPVSQYTTARALTPESLPLLTPPAYHRRGRSADVCEDTAECDEDDEIDDETFERRHHRLAQLERRGFGVFGTYGFCQTESLSSTKISSTAKALIRVSAYI